MSQRVVWFLIGATVASACWVLVLVGVQRQWLDALLNLH